MVGIKGHPPNDHAVGSGFLDAKKARPGIKLAVRIVGVRSDDGHITFSCQCFRDISRDEIRLRMENLREHQDTRSPLGHSVSEPFAASESWWIVCSAADSHAKSAALAAARCENSALTASLLRSTVE